MKSLPFFAQDVLMGEKLGIGLCTLWTPKKKYADQLPHVQVIGNLYSRFGVAVIIRNVLATPSIRAVAVTGVDHPVPDRRQGDLLLSGELGDVSDLYLEPEHVRLFYERVKLYDLRDVSLRDQATITKTIAQIQVIRIPPPEPIFVPLPEVTLKIFPAQRSGFLIRADSIRDAHVRLLKDIRQFGSITSPDSEGHIRQEIWQLMVVLTEEADWHAPLYTEDELFAYGQSLWEGDEPEGMTYRYGHSMRVKFGDQIEAVLESFEKKPETFRTVISLWEPFESLHRDDEPCLITVHPRIRNGCLDMYAYIRTNEMFRGWSKNASGLRYLQMKFAGATGTKVGELTITSGSAHLYDYDWPAVESYLSQQRKPPIVFDPKGSWRFTVEDGRYIAEHYYEGGLVQRFGEEDLDRLERRVASFISDVGHALYIGRELERLKQE